MDDFNVYAPEEDFIGYLDDRIPVLMKHYDIPGVNIALINDGKMVWADAYGTADIQEGRSMSLDTRCRVESISKSITVWGVMKLADEGRLDLDKPIGAYLKNWSFPDSEFNPDEITVKMLLTHTAGLPIGAIGVRYDPREEVPSLEDQLTEDAVLYQEPGRSFSYSNTGFNLLELLIEDVTGRNFADYMSEEILSPLGMKNSSFLWSEDFDPEIPDGHDMSINAIDVYVYPDKASGGLFATAADIADFVRAGMTDYNSSGSEVLTPVSIENIYNPKVEIPGVYGLVFDSYGFGHFIENLPAGHRAVSHGGQGSGWMTHFHSVPETGDGIVILANSQRSWPFFSILLSDWAKWCGFKQVGMGKIITVTRILWVFIFSLFIIALLHASWMVKSVLSGALRFNPLAGRSIILRSVLAGLSLITIIGVIRAVNLEYFFISSVFPVASPWLGADLIFGAAVLMMKVLFVKSENNALS